MSQQRETFVSFNKHSIYIKEWAAPHPKATLFLIHGLGEHSGSYDSACKALNERGITCFAADLIGHGQSSGQRGYTPSLNEFVRLLEHVTDHIVENFQIDKLHVFSHSLGGLIHLTKLQSGSGFKNQVSAIFSNPLLGINVDIPPWKITVAKNMAHFLPRLAMFNEIDPSDLSKDPQMQDVYTSDPLRHTKISARLFVEMQEQLSDLEYQTPNFNLPTLVLLSPSDKVCNAEKTQDFFTDQEFAQIELFPQSGHEIVNDLSKERAFDTISSFVLGVQS
ncbi:MAG: lysophospholipase [Bdellovibrionaceae bacterium]|nr:lysophospholipase [Pseudobdellovibrionaceae bacterium]